MAMRLDEFLAHDEAPPQPARLDQFLAQDKGLMEQGNINLYGQPEVPNPDGSISTVDSFSVNFDGREVLLPTVMADGRHLSQDQAIAEFQKTGRHLGTFDTPENATAYASQLHNDYAAGKYRRPPATQPMRLDEFMAQPAPTAQMSNLDQPEEAIMPGMDVAPPDYNQPHQWQTPEDIAADQQAEIQKQRYAQNAQAVEQYINSMPDYTIAGTEHFTYPWSAKEMSSPTPPQPTSEHAFYQWLKAHPFPVEAMRGLYPVHQQELLQKFEAKYGGKLPQLDAYQSAGAGMGEGFGDIASAGGGALDVLERIGQKLNRIKLGGDSKDQPQQVPQQKKEEGYLQQLGQHLRGQTEMLPSERTTFAAGRDMARAATNLIPAVLSGPAAPLTMGLQGAGSHWEAARESLRQRGLDPDKYENRLLLEAVAVGTLDAVMGKAGMGSGIAGAGKTAAAFAGMDAAHKFIGAAHGGDPGDIPADLYKSAATGVLFHYLAHPNEVAGAAQKILGIKPAEIPIRVHEGNTKPPEALAEADYQLLNPEYQSKAENAPPPKAPQPQPAVNPEAQKLADQLRMSPTQEARFETLSKAPDEMLNEIATRESDAWLKNQVRLEQNRRSATSPESIQNPPQAPDQARPENQPQQEQPGPQLAAPPGPRLETAVSENAPHEPTVTEAAPPAETRKFKQGDRVIFPDPADPKSTLEATIDKVPKQGTRVLVKDATGDQRIVSTKGMKLAGEVAGAPSPTVAAEKEIQSLRPGPGMTEGEVHVTPPEIIKAMEEAVDTPIRSGHGYHAQMGYSGWYNLKTDVVRTKVANDLVTAAHEFGHGLHNKILGWHLPIPKAVEEELANMGYELYGNRRPAQGYAREGIAEWTARHLMGEDMSQIAPAADAWMQKTIGDHPDFAKQFAGVKDRFQKWWAQGAVARVKAHIDKVDHTPIGGLKRGWERISKLFSDWSYLTANDAAPLERAEKMLLQKRKALDPSFDPEEMPSTLSPSKMRQALKMSAPGTARYFVESAAVNTRFEKVGQSLREALAPVKDQIDDFAAYAYARRALDLLERPEPINPGISFVEATATAHELVSKNPHFRDAMAAVTEWSNHFLNYLAESGALSYRAVKVIRELNPLYIPLKRVFENTVGAGPRGQSKGAVNQGGAIQRIKGSGRQIIDPIESFIEQGQRLISLGNKARVARSIIELAEQSPGSGWFAEKVQPPQTVESFALRDIERQLKDIGVELGNADLESVLNIFNNASRYTGKENIVVVWRNGEREFWELNPDVYKVVTEMDSEHLPAALRLLALGRPLVRAGATVYNASFAAANFIRDAMTATHFSKYIRNPLASFEGLWEQIKKTETVERYRATGAGAATLTGYQRVEASKLGRDILRSRTYRTLHHPLEAMREAIESIEAAPRMIEFKRSLAANEAKFGKGSEAAIIQALLDSKEATVDFTRMGIIGGAINSYRPFFNARIQGASKFLRTFKDNPVRATAHAIARLTIPSLLLWWINRDQEWYQEIPQWDKNNNWHFSVDDGKTIYRLPVPQGLGQVFATMPTAAIDAAYHQDSTSRERLNKSMWDMFSSFLPASHPIELAPIVIAPYAEAKFNFDPYKDRPIVPHYQEESRVPEDQYNKWTSETAKALGKLFHVSPAKVEHLLRGYTGGAATNLIHMIEAAFKGDWSKQETPVLGRFISRDPAGHGQSVAEVYDRQRALEQKKGSKAITIEERKELYQLQQTTERMALIRKRIDAGSMSEGAGNKLISSMARRALGKSVAEPLGDHKEQEH